jgi:ligand-binding sensor domain-containing protein
MLSLVDAPISLRKLNIQARHITDFLADRDGFYWILFEKGKVVRIDSDGNLARFNFNVDNILPMRLVEDAEGNVWLPGENGAVKFFSKHVDVFSVDNGMPSDMIMSIAYDNANNSLWAASKNGLSCITGNHVYNFKYPSKNYSWVKLMVTGDTLYLGLFGIYVYSIRFPGRPTLLLQKRWSIGTGLDDMITCMQKDNRGNLFFNMENRGLYFASTSGRLQKLHDRGLFSFLIDGDVLWTGAKADPASVWKIEYEADSVKLNKIRTYPQLANDHVRVITKDDSGNIWMGRLKQGLVQLRKHNDEYVIHNYHYEHGLFNGWIWKILMSRNAMYVATLGGLFKKRDVTTDSIYFDDLSRKNGYICEVYDVLEGPRNNLWLATDVGVLRLKSLLYKSTTPPKVHFTSLVVNNEPDSSIFFASRTPEYSYWQNSLLFEFSATSFTNEDHVLYSYALVEGSDQPLWSTPKNVHSVSLLSLSPGTYKLWVKAITQDDIQSDRSAQYSFTIKAPLWSTWWFRLSMILLVASGVALFYRFRLRQLRKVMNVRSKISRDLHDEIGSTLSGIGLMSEMVKRQIETENYKVVDTLVTKINSTSEEILGKMSDIVWAINPNNDTSEKMIRRLKNYANSMAGPSNTAVSFYANVAAERVNVGMQERNNIYLICKEAINNAVKYSLCKQLNIAFHADNNKLIIEVKDDGRGFCFNDDPEGNGLVNMQSRAEEIGAKLAITSAPNDGTSVKLTCKIT